MNNLLHDQYHEMKSFCLSGHMLTLFHFMDILTGMLFLYIYLFILFFHKSVFVFCCGFLQDSKLYIIYGKISSNVIHDTSWQLLQGIIDNILHADESYGRGHTPFAGPHILLGITFRG